MRWIAAASLCLMLRPALAHSSPVPEPLWEFDPWFVSPLLLTAALFLNGTINLWRTAGAGRGIGFGQQAAFWTGWSVLFFTIVSPLHWLGGQLFTAHMIEHCVLMLVAPPLLAYARPSGGMMWALPRRLRRPLGAIFAGSLAAALWSVFGNPVSATLIQAVALWTWHVPALFDWALRSEAAHRLEHLCFFFAALLFWWSLLHGRGPGRGERARDGLNIGCLFITVLHSGLLGALITLSPRLLYPAQVHHSPYFGFSTLQDQQLAGLVMWVPMGLIYTGSAMFFAYRWISFGQRRSAEEESGNNLRQRRVRSA
jgi:putative membrane protein